MLPIDLLRGFALLARAAGLLGQIAEETRRPIGMDAYLTVDRNAYYVDPTTEPSTEPSPARRKRGTATTAAPRSATAAGRSNPAAASAAMGALLAGP